MKKIFGLLLVSSLLMGQTAMAQQRRGGTVRKTTTTTRKPATAPAPVQLKNPDEALIAKAQEGDAEAQYQLGLLYFNGQGIIHSWTEAIKWFSLSADQGNANALYQLGLLYKQSLNETLRLPPEVIGCWREAAKRGDADAQNELGECYYRGLGVEESKTEAVKWWQKAADQGHADAQIRLGDFYVDSNKTESEKWYNLGLEQYRKLATQGNADALIKLGNCYYYGSGVEESETEAKKWYNLALAQYRKLAAQGNADAQIKLAECYEYGNNGVEESDSEAAKWYRKAAEQGNVQAQYQLGAAYNIGSGVEESEIEAMKWYLKAAEQGHAEAQYMHGEDYYHGSGVEQSDIEAVKWYRKAAEQGHVEAMTRLGIFTHGFESVKWYKRAAKRGDAFAIKKLKNLGITDYEESQEFIPSSNFVHSKYCEAESVKYFLYPTREWGCSKDEVKDFMAGYSIYIEENDWIMFSGKYRETKTTYYFTKNGSLSSVVITIPNGRWDQAALMQTILKDYIFVAKDSKEDTYMFNCKDNKSCLNLSFREKENDAIIYLLP